MDWTNLASLTKMGNTKRTSLPFTYTVLILLSVTACNSQRLSAPKYPEQLIERISTDSLLTLVQHRTFQYFWNGAEPVSGLARERYHDDGNYPQNDKDVVATGGSGFAVMAIIVAIERGFISREEGLSQLLKITNFLKYADRYKGAWSHWMIAETGKTKPFSPKDNGADLVETAFLIQGLLTVKEYFDQPGEEEEQLRNTIDQLWRDVNWNWFTNGGQHVLYWHWSPDYNWEINHQIRGWDECLIVYILAASSPTFPISAEVYHSGWAREGEIVSTNSTYGIDLLVNHNSPNVFGGPLFWSHYSFLGLDPRNLKDKYANYWDVNRNHTLINRNWCVENPKEFEGYGANCWGLTASYSLKGYAAHAPGDNSDLGVISPTAALSAFPYTPEYSMEALENFYYNLGDSIFGNYGFYDAFSLDAKWFPKKYLAIDQGPAIVMIENYRTGLLWDLFMSNSDVKNGLEKLGFTW